MTAYLGPMLLAAALACLCARRWPLSRGVRLAALLAAAAAVVLPVGELDVAAHIRAVAGDLSIATQALLMAFVAGWVSNRPLLDRRQLGAVSAAAVAGGAFLYPGALGLLPMDPYALGYASIPFAAALAALTALAWLLKLHWLAGCMLLGACGRLLGVLESRNLWDYLLDPWLALFAFCWLCSSALPRRAAPGHAPQRAAG